eukprot:GAHX01002051.1.p1 GENE.GAHX01002051.1~~GAHX01002051.1.p1  ORF type:complete len:316 (+),score=88.78 GAHX01002051.1:31-948(+)
MDINTENLHSEVDFKNILETVWNNYHEQEYEKAYSKFVDLYHFVQENFEHDSFNYINIFYGLSLCLYKLRETSIKKGLQENTNPLNAVKNAAKQQEIQTRELLLKDMEAQGQHKVIQFDSDYEESSEEEVDKESEECWNNLELLRSILTSCTAPDKKESKDYLYCKETLCKVYNLLGNIAGDNGSFEIALEDYLNALSTCQEVMKEKEESLTEKTFKFKSEVMLKLYGIFKLKGDFGKCVETLKNLISLNKMMKGIVVNGEGAVKAQEALDKNIEDFEAKLEFTEKKVAARKKAKVVVGTRKLTK